MQHRVRDSLQHSLDVWWQFFDDAFKKTTRVSPQRNITVAQRRLHEVIA